MKHRFLAMALAAIMGTAGASASHFGWGADIGTSIDVSGHDMSTINLDAYFGYKNQVINLAGVGAGINMMVSNSCRSFPVYGVFRTGFRPGVTLCFMDLRAGIAFNNLSDNSNQTSPYINPSIGFNLATGRSYRSYLIVGYVYNGLKSFADTSIAGGLSYVNVRFGITF